MKQLSTKVKTLIIEDRQLMAAILEDLLKEYHPEIDIIGIARNGKMGLEMIDQLSPDLVFLDIEMPDMNGFEMLNKLDDITFQTIFVTAHTHYAIKAFRFNALDYLVKPIDAGQLNESVQRFKANSSLTMNQNHIKQALANLQSVYEDQQLILSTHRGDIYLALKQIVWIESERNYSCLYLSNGKKEISSKTLGHFEYLLNDKGFFRCHRSFLLNRSHVESLIQDFFKMSDQSEIPISRRKKNEAKIWYHG